MRHALAAAAVLMTGLLPPVAAAQFQVLYTEDFEDGLEGWTIASPNPPPSPLWHLAEPGECWLGTSRMAAYCLPEPSCTYATGSGFTWSNLCSEPFLLTGNQPFNLKLAGIWDFDTPSPGNAGASSPYLEDTVTGGDLFFNFQVTFSNHPGELVTVSTDFWTPFGFDLTHPVRVCFQGFSDSTHSSTGAGMRYDDIQVRSSAYSKYGVGIPGYSVSEPKTPGLEGYGPLVPGSSNTLRMTTLLPNAVAVLVFGVEPLELPFKGGVMYPEPSRLWVVPTGNAFPGFASLVTVPFTLPAFPPGLELYFQVWLPDLAAIEGWAASNGLKGVTS